MNFVKHEPLISVAALAAVLDDPALRLVDCRFALTDPDAGRAAYDAAHIPGAIYAHLDQDLSAPVRPGVTGRHPLPDRAGLARRLGGWGVGDDDWVVAYDASGGAMASRLWWLLRWLGHERVLVLDGGWQAWLSADKPVSAAAPSLSPREFTVRAPLEAPVDAGFVMAMAGDGALLDARASDRFRGENETLDPVAGHIPGAFNLPFTDNLAADGCFLPPEQLKARFRAVCEGTDGPVVSYCGSGVTACHNLLAMRIAGVPRGRLYAGSWSEWITDPARPVARGSD